MSAATAAAIAQQGRLSFSYIRAALPSSENPLRLHGRQARSRSAPPAFCASPTHGSLACTGGFGRIVAHLSTCIQFRRALSGPGQGPVWKAWALRGSSASLGSSQFVDLSTGARHGSPSIQIVPSANLSWAPCYDGKQCAKLAVRWSSSPSSSFSLLDTRFRSTTRTRQALKQQLPCSRCLPKSLTGMKATAGLS
jgi:hypothetical protein